MPDLSKVKTNIGKMIEKGASEQEIDEYISLENTTPEEIRSFKPEQSQSQETRWGLFGSVPEEKYQGGERNVMGNIGERPAAAMRSLLQGKGYTAGAVNPTQVPKFQDLAIEKFAPKTSSTYLNYMGGQIPSAAGLAADVATDPLSVLLMLAGKTPIGGGRNIGQLLAGTKLGQATEKVMTTPINIKKMLPKVMTDKWLMQRSGDLYQSADDAVKMIRGEYANLFDAPTEYGEPLGNMAVKSPEKLQAIATSVFESDPAIAKQMAQKIGQNAPENIKTAYAMKDIVDDNTPGLESLYRKMKAGFQITPKQERLVKAHFDLKDLIKETLAGTEEGEYLSYLDKKATDVYRLSKTVKKMTLDELNRPQNTSQMVNIFEGGSKMAGRRSLIQLLGEFDDKANQVIKDMGKFAFRQKVKSATIGRLLRKHY